MSPTYEAFMDSQIQQLEKLQVEMEVCVKLMRLESSPSMLEGITVSNESALDVIKNVAQKLLELIYKAFDRFLNIMSSTRNQSENRIVAAKQLIARIEDLQPVGRLPYMTVNDGTYLTTNGDTPTPRDIYKGIIKLREVFFTESIDNMEYSTRMTDRLLPKIDTLLNKYDSLPPDDVLRLTQLIAEDVFQLRKKYLTSPHLKPTNEPHIYSTGDLLGLMEIEYDAEPIDETSLRGVSYRLTSTLETMLSTRGYINNHSDNNSVEYKVLPATGKEQRQLLEETIRLLNVSIEFHIRYYKKVIAMRNKIKEYRNKFNSLSSNNQNDEGKVYLRKISRILHAMNRWIYSPAIPLLSHILKTANGIIQYCQKSQSTINNATP